MSLFRSDPAVVGERQTFVATHLCTLPALALSLFPLFPFRRHVYIPPAVLKYIDISPKGSLPSQQAYSVSLPPSLPTLALLSVTFLTDIYWVTFAALSLRGHLQWMCAPAQTVRRDHQGIKLTNCHHILSAISALLHLSLPCLHHLLPLFSFTLLLTLFIFLITGF